MNKAGIKRFQQLRQKVSDQRSFYAIGGSESVDANGLSLETGLPWSDDSILKHSPQRDLLYCRLAWLYERYGRPENGTQDDEGLPLDAWDWLSGRTPSDSRYDPYACEDAFLSWEVVIDAYRHQRNAKDARTTEQLRDECSQYGDAVPSYGAMLMGLRETEINEHPERWPVLRDVAWTGERLPWFIADEGCAA